MQHQREPSAYMSTCDEQGADLGNRVTSVYVSRTWSSRRRAISRSALLSCLQEGTPHMVKPCTACSEEQGGYNFASRHWKMDKHTMQPDTFACKHAQRMPTCKHHTRDFNLQVSMFMQGGRC